MVFEGKKGAEKWRKKKRTFNQPTNIENVYKQKKNISFLLEQSSYSVVGCWVEKEEKIIKIALDYLFENSLVVDIRSS